MLTKPWQLLIEGAHRVGKDEIAKEICKQSNYQHSLQIRGSISNYAFSLLLKRPVPSLWETFHDCSHMTRFAIIHVQHKDIRSLNDEFREKFPHATYSNSELAGIIQGACRLASQGFEIPVIQVNARSDTPANLTTKLLSELGLSVHERILS